MTAPTVLPVLKAPLPDELAWLEDDVQALMRPTAFIKSPRTTIGVAHSIAPLGCVYVYAQTHVTYLHYLFYLQ